MARYQLTRRAGIDLQQIWNHIAEDNFDAADRLRDEFRSVFERLAEFPYIGHVREDIVDASHRFSSVRSYLVVYRPEPRPLQIIRVIHGARDVKAMFGS